MEIKELQSKTEILITELSKSLEADVLVQGEQKYTSGKCQLLTLSPNYFYFIVNERYVELTIETELFTAPDNSEKERIQKITPSNTDWDAESFACLLTMKQVLGLDQTINLEHKQYTRHGMIQRVLAERQQKARQAKYRIAWADNIYGDHILTNENGVKYKIFLRDFENETGYSNSKDSAVNKLGTTKHIMYAFETIKNSPGLFKKLSDTCPFVEVYCDPLNDYKISYFYPHALDHETESLFNRYFNPNKVVDDYQLSALTQFFFEARTHDHIVIRPEVFEKVNDYLENLSLQALHQNFFPDFNAINATLYDYQKEGIAFASCRKHAIIADEMGLGKTIQAIGTAVAKKELFGFTKTLVVCPASLKEQWKKEIEKFTTETAEVITGTPEERELQYKKSDAYFLIINYETVLRDQVALNKARIDFLILDEAQKVKNYATKTASAIKNVGRKHVLIITGTPIENKLIDLFSLMTILDPHLLGPLWEFSYQYCLFDNDKPNKINAYYNLVNLKEVLKPVLLRREKRKVIEQLPNVQQQDIPVKMTPLQADYHASYASGIGQITNKKFLTAFDLQRLQQLLTAMRMVCNSSYLIDETTNDSPKLDELKYILLDKLNLKYSDHKVIIFSEWVKMHKLIGQMLLKNNIGYSELNGSVPVKKRGEIIAHFEKDPNCKVFLSTEAGGAGLNLQVADILVNFELPWNPAKKNQRIGRIDRLGQKSSRLTIFNLVTVNSIEQRIAMGLLVKQNLFDSVLNDGHKNDFVDFTEKGRGQFLQQMKELAGEFDNPLVGTVEDETLPEDKGHIENTHEESIENELPFEEEYRENEDAEIAEEQTVTEKTQAESTAPNHRDTAPDAKEKAKQMEQVLNNGMQFLSGLMKMATGKDLGMEEQKIEVNQETGEVTMKFKLPGF